jgi:hypothetical protein
MNRAIIAYWQKHRTTNSQVCPPAPDIAQDNKIPNSDKAEFAFIPATQECRWRKHWQ